MKIVAGDRTGEVVSVSRAKEYLRLRTIYSGFCPDEMARLENAIEMVEAETSSTLGTRDITATIYADEVCRGAVSLPRGPVREITSCVDADGHAVAADLRVFGKDDQLHFRSTPRFPVTCVYKAGHYPKVPGALQQVTLAFLQDLYDNRTLIQEGQQKPWIARTFAFYRRGPLVG